MTADYLTLNELRCGIERKAIRHLYLRVLAPDGEVRVTAPMTMANETIRAFITKKQEWIKKQQNRIKTRAIQPASNELAEIMVWGQIMPVQFLHGPGNIRIHDNKIVAALPGKPKLEEWQALLKSWRKSLLEPEVPPILEKWRKKLDLQPISFGIRNMKKRWGSCYPTRNRIILNSELVKKQPICLELVILHELLHFFVPSHSKDFYASLDSWLPNWREIDSLLLQ